MMASTNSLGRRLCEGWLCGFACLLFASLAGAKDWYAAPNGTPSGNGSVSMPWDLRTALGTETCSPPNSIRPGDTLWLLPGIYRGGFKSCLNGTATAPIIVRNYEGGRVTLDGTGASMVLFTAGSNTWFWGLEFADLTATQRVGQIAGSNQMPAGLAIGVGAYGPGLKYINCIVHDTGQGFSGYNAAPDLELYGSLSYYNGYVGPDRNHGHGIYMQNTTGAKLISDNFVGDNADEGIQIYGSPKASVVNFTVVGNALYNTASWPEANYQSNLVTGAGDAHDNKFAQNMSFFTLSRRKGSVNIGQYMPSRDLEASDNVFAGGYVGVSVEGVNSPFTFERNKLVNIPAGPSGGPIYTTMLAQFPGQDTTAYSWDNNQYYGMNNFYRGNYDGINVGGGTGMPFDEWRKDFDKNSTFSSALPKGKWIYVRPNKYEAKRANIIIYNWDAYDSEGNIVPGKSPSVSVDLSSILSVGDQFVIRDVQNFFGPPVVSGKYDGHPITIPMEGLTKGVPVGFAAPPHTAPGFGTFIVMVPSADTNLGISQ